MWDRFAMLMEQPHWLVILLQESGISQERLSQLTGVDSSVFTNIKKGRRGIGPDVARKIAKALKIPDEEIFRRAGLLGKKAAHDELAEQAGYLFEQIETEEGKRSALAMLRGLVGIRHNKKQNHKEA